jgi:trk system potassium uptake protein TrkA
MAQSYVVLGLGTFGYQLAVNLMQGGGQVLAIDNSEDRIQRISSQVTKAAVADIKNMEALQSLDVFEVDAAIVAMPDHFDVSVLITHSLKKAGVETILVQVQSHEETEAIKLIGATRVILPESDMAGTVAQQLLTPLLGYQIPLGKNGSIIEFKCPPSWIGQSLLDLEIRKKYDALVVGIRQKQDEEEDSEEENQKESDLDILPPPDQPLDSEDVLVVVGKTDNLIKFTKKLDIEVLKES